jgi:hypothetical protein
MNETTLALQQAVDTLYAVIDGDVPAPAEKPPALRSLELSLSDIPPEHRALCERDLLETMHKVCELFRNSAGLSPVTRLHQCAELVQTARVHAMRPVNALQAQMTPQPEPCGAP